MPNSKSSVQKIVVHTILPVACSLLIGAVFFQDHVLDRHYPAFQFLWNAVVASVFYQLLLHLRSRDAFAGILLLFFLTLLTTGSHQAAFILRDALYIAAIGTSIFVYYRFSQKNFIHNAAYPPFMLAGIYAVLNSAASVIHVGIIRSLARDETEGALLKIVSTSAFFGALIGFAIGAGISINERLSSLMKTNYDGATTGHSRKSSL
jgi:hypothetical protein